MKSLGVRFIGIQVFKKFFYDGIFSAIPNQKNISRFSQHIFSTFNDGFFKTIKMFKKFRR